MLSSQLNTYFFKQSIHWANKNYPLVAVLNSNGFDDRFSDSSFDFVVGVGTSALETADPFESIKTHFEKTKSWLFGYFGYDLKNKLEKLSSNNQDSLFWSDSQFFMPELVVVSKKGKLSIHSFDGSLHSNEKKVLHEIENTQLQPCNPKKPIIILPIVDKTNYLQIINKIKKHIQRGDVYELNYCMEFCVDDCTIDPVMSYLELCIESPAPFSAFYKSDDKFLICASPERFIKKSGSKLISQPIKGTIKRGKTREEDVSFATQLRESKKEQSENVMVVDMVRNDLSKTARKNSVVVEELFGIYSFKHVHQMISTVSSILDPKIHFVEAIKQAFPMGSMTGTPKVKAMELIEKYEITKRGLYSGSVGYILPDEDFDFNVVIRSIQYNRSEKYISFMVGSAITAQSEPESEYRECLLKANAMAQLLTGSPIQFDI